MMFRTAVAWCLAFAGMVAIASVASALTITPKEEYWALDGGTMGTRGLRYPVLMDANQKVVHKLTEKKIEGNSIVLKYEGGAAIEATVGDDGTITLEFSDVPADVGHFQLNMMIPLTFIEGGTWKFGAGEEQPFPREKPSSPMLYQGGAGTFTLKHPEGRALQFTLPSEYAYNQLQDNREWGTKLFQWLVFCPFHGEVTTYKIRIVEAAGGASAAAPRPIVDEFGQNARADFPDKVRSFDELRSDVEAEQAYYASLNPPSRDIYGGLLGSGETLGLQKTGFFHVEQHGERWVLVDPEGNAFFQLGVSSFMPMSDYTYVEGRKHAFAWLPPADGEFATAYMPASWDGSGRINFSFHLANMIRKYGRPFDFSQYQSLMIQRVRKWGFNSIGAFSRIDKTAVDTATFPYMRELPLNAYSGMPILPGVRETFDPFDEKARERATQAFARSLTPLANDPLLIGYYLSNEPALEDLPRVIPTLSGKYACKRRLVRMLQDKYGTIDAFKGAWGIDVATFEDLIERGLAVKTQAAASDMQEFTGLFLDEYYRFVRDAVRQVDPNHILIGNRLQAGTINNEQLCRISGKYLDAISFNYYTYSIDKNFLKRIYGWSSRPMFLSEFYWGSPGDSGLPGGVKDAGSQDERGLAYRNYVEQAASLGFVIGIEWYTLNDMAYSGVYYQKYTGDNANCGLISVTDRPWKTMLGHMAQTNYDVYAVQLGEKAPFTYDHPRYRDAGVATKTAKIYRTDQKMVIDGRNDGWPNIPSEVITTDRVVEGADGGGVEAHYKLCYDDQSLYLMIHVTDATPMKNQLAGDMLWSADGIELFIGHEKLDQAGPLLFTDRQILLSAGAEPRWHVVNAPVQGQCNIAVVPDVNGRGYTLEAAIPFTSLGFTPQDGRELRFDLAVDDSSDGRSRLRQLMWNGVARNAGDRTHWGRAVFVR